MIEKGASEFMQAIEIAEDHGHEDVVNYLTQFL